MQGNTPWGGFGALVRPRHWEKYWQQAKALQCGNFPYSEGIFEDVQKFLMLQLNWTPERSVDSILREYGSGVLGVDADAFIRLCELLEEDEGSSALAGDDGFLFHNPGGLPQAEAAVEQVKLLEKSLPTARANAWRWRIFHLRASIDAELKRSNLQGSITLNQYFRELVDIYHADPEQTRDCVMPPWQPE